MRPVAVAVAVSTAGSNLLPVRRYASAVLAVARCLPVSVTYRYCHYCVETTGRIELIFGLEASFNLSYVEQLYLSLRPKSQTLVHTVTGQVADTVA